MQYHFEWDPAKARSNLRKHGVSFEQAATVFRDPRALSLYDRQHSATEERWMTLGVSQTGGLLAWCTTRFMKLTKPMCVLGFFRAERLAVARLISMQNEP